MKLLKNYLIKLSLPLCIFLFFLVFNTQSFAQFQIRHYAPSSIYEWPRSLDALKNEGYVITGGTLLGTWHPFIMMTDKNGEEIWNYTYNLSGWDEHFKDIVTAHWSNNKLFAAVGIADGTNNTLGSFDIYFLLIDKLGAPIASKRIGTPDGEYANHIISITHPEFKNCFVITGKAMTNGSTNAFAAIVSDTGNLYTGRTLDFKENQKAKWIEYTKDGGFIIVGENDPFDYNKGAVFILKLDPFLNVKWHIIYDIQPQSGFSQDIAYSVKEDASGYLTIAGTMRVNNGGNIYYPFLLKLDKNGKLLWAKKYEFIGYGQAKAYSHLAQAINGEIEYVINGETGSSMEPFILKTDKDGEVIWTKTYPSSNPMIFRRGERLIENKDKKGYAFTGRTFGYWIEGSGYTGYDINLIETDMKGETYITCEQEVKVIAKEVEIHDNKTEYTGHIKMTEMTELPAQVPLDVKPYYCKDE